MRLVVFYFLLPFLFLSHQFYDNRAMMLLSVKRRPASRDPRQAFSRDNAVSLLLWRRRRVGFCYSGGRGGRRVWR